MLIIRCPCCLELRHEDELLYGGELDVIRPAEPDAASDTQWCDYLYMRTNAGGVLYEQWCCAAGCGQWFQVARESTTQAILGITRMHETLELTGSQGNGRH